MKTSYSIPISELPLYKIVAIHLGMFSKNYILTNNSNQYKSSDIATHFDFKQVENSLEYITRETVHKQFYRVNKDEESELNNSILNGELTVVNDRQRSTKMFHTQLEYNIISYIRYRNKKEYPIINNFIKDNPIYLKVLNRSLLEQSITLRMYESENEIYNNTDGFCDDIVDKIKFYEDNKQILNELCSMSLFTTNKSLIRISLNNFYKLKRYTKYLDGLEIPKKENIHKFINHLLLLKKTNKVFDLNFIPFRITRKNEHDKYIKFVFGGINIGEIYSFIQYKYKMSLPIWFIVSFLEKSKQLDKFYSIVLKESFKNV